MIVSPTITSLPGPKLSALSFSFVETRRIARSYSGSSRCTLASSSVVDDVVVGDQVAALVDDHAGADHAALAPVVALADLQRDDAVAGLLDGLDDGGLALEALLGGGVAGEKECGG